MAKISGNIESVAAQLIESAKNLQFKPVYLLMGDEPFYLDAVCDAIVGNCVEEAFKDFNQYIYYGSDTDAETVVSSARQFPMMSDRTLVVVKEAQLMKDIEQLQYYCQQPLDSTVLVLYFYKSSPDKRKALYKTIQKNGVVLDSPAVKDYELTAWIIKYFDSRGLRIEPEAAQLMGESTGTDLGMIASETDKLLKSLPVGTTSVSTSDIESNVGISRQFNIFELNKELGKKNAPRALKIAYHVGSAAKFAMPMATSAMFTHFYRILRYAALLQNNPRPTPEMKAKALAGVNPYFYREYDDAVRVYPLPKCMSVIALLKEFDYKGKGGDGGDMDQGHLLMELVVRILNL